MSRRFLFALVLVSLAALGRAQEPQAPTPLLGRIEGDTYISPTGAFSIRIPIMAALDGMVSDTANVVTFQDDFTHISIAAFPQDMTQKWELDTEGAKAYLESFFQQYVFSDFVRSNPKATYETDARFNSGAFGGTFIAYVLLPGGSMFDLPGSRIAAEPTPPVAKRGNMLFVHDGFIYVISTELGERVTEGSAYHLTDAQEDELLRNRLFNIAAKIQFSSLPASPG